MTAVTLRCLEGHTTEWDPDAEEYPAEGCDEVLAYDEDGTAVYCALRYGIVGDPSERASIAQDISRRLDEKHNISDIVSPDAETTTNDRGGKQSHVPVRFDLIDGKALFAMAAVLHEGAEKYSPGNWRLIPERDHLNHALMHIYAYLSGDRTDDHLSHALCRITFATAVNIDPEAGPERDE